ncbi:hypothetical protein V7x_51990 [Crateriforma conspicua]|uniref:Uncharacterized protein n=1 Tax=Crateriforma conspicua TaxID=2527996 RepID=A0A5C6FPX8_9PLAN|nr:hypothetical protein V7x_51990 [Crateriforma conspicua]
MHWCSFRLVPFGSICSVSLHLLDGLAMRREGSWRKNATGFARGYREDASFRHTGRMPDAGTGQQLRVPALALGALLRAS